MQIQKVVNCGSKPSHESVYEGYKRKQVGGGEMNNKGLTRWWKTCWLTRWQKSSNVLTSPCPCVDNMFDASLICEWYSMFRKVIICSQIFLHQEKVSTKYKVDQFWNAHSSDKHTLYISRGNGLCTVVACNSAKCRVGRFCARGTFIIHSLLQGSR